MALEGEELTALTVEQKSEGVQHRERVATHLAQEKKWSMSSTWPVLVVLITNIALMLVSLVLAVLTEDTMCIITAAMTGIVVFLCLLAVFFPPSFKDTDTFNNQEAVCLFHSRISSDDPAFKRYCDHELPQMLATNTTAYRYATTLIYIYGLGVLASLGLVVGIGVFFIVIISEIETLLCSLGLLAQLGVWILLILWGWVQVVKEMRKEPNHEDLFNTECSLFDDGILVVGRNKCIRLDNTEGTKVEWSENQDVKLLKVVNTSIVLSSEVKERQWWKALVGLRRELNDIV